MAFLGRILPNAELASFEHGPRNHVLVSYCMYSTEVGIHYSCKQHLVLYGHIIAVRTEWIVPSYMDTWTDDCMYALVTRF